MADTNKKPGDIDRRKFITEAGALALGGAAALAGIAPPEARAASVASAAQSVTVGPSGVIAHDPTRCAGCGVCGMMCSLFHEGAVGPALSRSDIVRDPFSYDFTYVNCEQCRKPECYFACPLRDIARCIDKQTGARYINEAECIGCGACIEACPFDPPRTRLHPAKRVAITCDLCMGRDQGPICVQYCAMQALTYVKKEQRGD